MTHIQEALHKLRAFTLEAAAQHFLQVDEPQVLARELAALCAGDIRDRSQVLHMRPHTPVPLCMCPRTSIYVSSYSYICVLMQVGLVAGRILVHLCPRTSAYVSSYSYICVLVLVYVS